MEITPVVLIKQLLAAMEMRETTGQRPASYDTWMELAKRYYSADAGQSRALSSMFDALRMQDLRETEEFHLSQEVMAKVWSQAKEDAHKAIKREHFRPAVNRKATSGLKKRGVALGSAMEAFGAPLASTQALHVLARTYGYECHQALLAATMKAQPAFCPHCGLAGTLEPGVSAKDSPNFSYMCQSCLGTFAAPKQSADYGESGK